jgi:hypothetical protein
MMLHPTAAGVSQQFGRPGGGTLTPGNYVVEVYDFFATDLDPGTPGNTCMNFTITVPEARGACSVSEFR